MEKNDNIKDTAAMGTTVELRIAKAIASIKRTSERVIGITNIDYTYARLTYNGTTVRPEPITPLERAVVGIIDIDGDASLEKVGKILGLDIVHDNAEKDMLLEAINKMKGYGILEGDESYFSLTEKGEVFAKEGERPVTYTKDFTISYDDKHPDYLYLDADFPSSKLANETIPISSTSALNDIHTIKAFAEMQAPSVQNEKNRYILQSATLKSAESIVANIFVVILQSIRDENEFRVFAYDDTQESILPHLSELIQNEREWILLLLEQCIKNSLILSEEDGGWTIVPSEQEKNDVQKAIEAELVQCEDDEAEGKEIEGNDLERLHKKAIYDQVSFEFELDKIFRQDNPDEVWVISPFVSWSFVKVRAKQFEPLLKANKRIFIAYSEPYDNRPTISPEAEQAVMKEINRLSETYPNFYYVELPKFHTKQVLEVKNGQCVLFNGSFNVLSFDNVSAGRKVSREEMALVHHQVAISKHQEYIETFANIYSKRILDEINRSKNPKDVAEIKSDRIDYLHQISENKDIFLDFYTEYDEKTLQAKNTAWYEECEELMGRINQFNENGSVDQNDFKTISASYQRLIKGSVALTTSSTTVLELEKAYTNLEKLPKSKNRTKDASKRNRASSLITFDSLSDQAMAIINASNFEKEKDVTLYVSALNFLYANRAFKNPSEATKYLKKILNNSMATSIFSVFDYAINKNGKMLDITIGIGGYSFRLFGICPINMETKLSTIRIPKGTTRLENVNLKNLEDTFKTLINE
ncbi:hypothetical protein [Parabacteroides johnsonii]|uniref:hypothetical protein n=1 Tax=Parabacteroides johnsonii TaxID=387661 RepID=UPI0011DD96D3|nr:hypothetical protein [Parabacteroides johnsonii]